jgi:hypothetical protein
MALFEDMYDQLKIEKLKQTLQKQSDLGKPQYFEVYVDGLKAVPKTNDINEFDNYENFMMEDTEKIRILVYTTSPVSPRNDQFTYRMKKQKEEPVLVQTPAPAQTLSGVDIEAKIDEKLRQQRERWTHEMVKRELEQTKKQLKEAEDYAEKLENELTVLRSKKAQIGNLDLGELASVAIEGIVRRNPQILAKIPGGESLAGIIEADNKEKQNSLASAPEPVTEVSFKKKSDENISTDESGVLSEEEKGYLQFMRGIAESFDEEEIVLLTNIIQKLEEDTGQLKPVAELLNMSIDEVLKAQKIEG